MVSGQNTAHGRCSYLGAREVTARLPRTVVYVDGFNLYFGCLKRAPRYRWLDIAALAARLCRAHDPCADVVGVKYFSAQIRARLSPRGDTSCKAQQEYWLALRSHSPELEIIAGQFFVVPRSYHPDPGRGPVDFGKKVRVLRPEEKQTDVNIALHMLADATDGCCEQQVLLSNDSDCVPALKMIRMRHPTMRLGVVAPILGSESGRREPSGELREHSDWTRRVIDESDLAACQLPEKVTTRKRNIRRPERWR